MPTKSKSDIFSSIFYKYNIKLFRGLDLSLGIEGRLSVLVGKVGCGNTTY